MFGFVNDETVFNDNYPRQHARRPNKPKKWALIGAWLTPENLHFFIPRPSQARWLIFLERERERETPIWSARRKITGFSYLSVARLYLSLSRARALSLTFCAKDWFFLFGGAQKGLRVVSFVYVNTNRIFFELYLSENFLWIYFLHITNINKKKHAAFDFVYFRLPKKSSLLYILELSSP